MSGPNDYDPRDEGFDEDQAAEIEAYDSGFDMLVEEVRSDEDDD